MTLDTPCIDWTGARDADGYGIRKIGGVVTRAHRYAYEQAYGPIPAGLVVLHECDNPSCINPEHLRAGTQADNLADMTDKGRRARVKGEDHYATTLTDNQIRAIRRAKHAPRKTLAKRYGISQGMVSDIRSRRTWAHVKD